MPTLKKAKTKKQSGPVWGGPMDEGITFSLISKYLICKERFRLLVIEGLREEPEFNHRIEYGNLWHCCEEAHAKGICHTLPLLDYAKRLAKQYPLRSADVDHWYQVCKAQFPHYVEYWRKHKDMTKRKPLMQEKVFNMPYKLPSGRVVLLRGKWDSVDLVGGKGIWLQENKTKADISEQMMQRQLTFDLQTMLYLVALRIVAEFSEPIAGVRYNVIRRPLSGGKHSIRQHKGTSKNPEGESSEEFYNRLGELIAGDPAYFFMRWNVPITNGDVHDFKVTCLDPILENICDDYEWWKHRYLEGSSPWSSVERIAKFPKHISHHYRMPYGVYSPLLDGGPTEVDEYLATGSMLGLRRVDKLMEELDASS